MVRFRLSILCVGVSLFAGGQAFGQATVTWTGNYSDNFYESTPGYNPLNWLDGVVPLYNGTDVVGFTAGVTANSTLDINSAAPGTNLLGIDVEASAFFGENATITDTAIGLGSYGIVVNGLSTSSSSLVLSAPVTLNVSQTWSVAYGQIVVNQPISMSEEAQLTLAGAPGTGANFILNSSGSSISDGISVTGAGTVLTLGASSVGPSTDLDSGPVGTGTLSMGSGTILATPNGIGQITIGNAIEVASGVLLSPGTCSSFLLSGSISDLSGPGTIEVTGGTVILTGTNTYSGGTTIDSGATLQIGDGGTCGSITGNVIDNSTLAFDLSNCTTFCGSICGTGGITVEDGTVTLMGDNSYSGYTLVSSAALKDGATGTLSPNSAVWLENSATLSVGYNETINGLKGDSSTTVCIASGSTLLTDGSNGSCNYNYEGTIMGSGALEIGSGGYQILTGSNSYSGGTTIDGMATLQLGNGGTSGSISGDVVDNGTLAFDLSNCNTFCGAICGTGGLLVESGAVTLLGENSYTGGTTISCMATLQLGNGGTSGTIVGGVADNGTLAFDLSNCTTFCGPITGSGGVTVEDGTVTLMGTNTYSGTTLVTNAKLQDGAAGSFSPNSAVNLTDDATLGVNYNETINGLSGDCSTTVCISSGSTLLTDGYNGSCLYTYSGTIMGGGALEVGSNAFQILTGSNTYSGGTTIDCMATLQLGNGGTGGSITGGVLDNGTLAFDLSSCSSFSAGITGTGGIIVENGTVTLSGTNTYSGTTSVNSATLKDGAANSFSPTSSVSLSDGSLSVGFNEAIGGLAGDCSSTVCITCGSTLVVSGGGDYAGTIMGGGALEIGTNAYQILTGSNTYSGGTTIDSGGTLQVGGGDDTGSITGNVVDNGNLAFSNSGCTTFSGSICGSGDVYVEAGTVTFTGTNTYGGTTYVSSASLKDGAADSFSPNSAMTLTNGASVGVNYDEVIDGLFGDCSNTVCIASGSTLLTDGFNTGMAFAGSIMGSGALEVGENAYQILTGSNTYSGGTTIDCMATLQLGEGGSNGSIEGSVFDNGTLEFDLASCTSFCGTISGSGSVLIEDGVVTLMGDNTYSGGTTIEGGTTLYVTNSSSLGTGTLTAYSTECAPAVLAPSGGCVTLANNIVVGGSGLTLNFSGSPKLTLTGTISDAGSDDTLTINGPVDLEGNNTYSGGTTINSACVTIGTSTGLGTGALTATGSTLTFTSNSSPTLNCATIQSDSTATFNGASTILRNLNLAESTLNFNGASATLNNMQSDSSGSGNTINISGDTQLTFNVSCDTETDYHGVITDNGTGTGTLLVTGSGLLNLKSANSYGGGTTVNGGLLVASNCSALGTGPVTVNGTAALGLDVSVALANQVTLNSGGALGGFGTFNPASADCIAIQNGSLVVGGAGSITATGGGSSNIVGTLSFGSNASLVLGGGGVLQFSIMNATGTPGTDYSQIEVAGTANVTASNVDPFTVQLVGVDSTGMVVGTANTFNPTLPYTWTLLSAGTVTNFNASAFVVDSSTYFSNPTNSGLFSVSLVGNDLTLNFTPVPEPSTWALMASGLCAAFGAAVRRRRRS